MVVHNRKAERRAILTHVLGRRKPARADPGHLKMAQTAAKGQMRARSPIREKLVGSSTSLGEIIRVNRVLVFVFHVLRG